MVSYLRELNTLKCSRNTVYIFEFISRIFFIFLLQSIEDRLKAINSVSSETQRYVYVVIGVVCCICCIC